jgi:hypothetical protein
MSRMRLHELLLRNLAQTIPQNRRGYMPREKAYEELKKHTLQDFGYDARAWKRWFKGKTMREAMPGAVQDPRKKEERIDFLKGMKTLILIREIRWVRDSIMVIPEEVLDELKTRTGQDFGYDADAWEVWFEQNQDKDDSQSK